MSDQTYPASSNRLRRKVLSIDDDPAVSGILRVRLASFGIEVARAFSGTQGYWTALDEKPDLIICDLTMPDGEGNYVFGRLQDNPLTKHVPFVVLSGQCNPAVKRTLLSMGVAAFLPKPIVFRELLQELRPFLDFVERADPGACARAAKELSPALERAGYERQQDANRGRRP